MLLCRNNEIMTKGSATVSLCVSVGVWRDYVGDCYAGHDPVPGGSEPRDLRLPAGGPETQAARRLPGRAVSPAGWGCSVCQCVCVHVCVTGIGGYGCARVRV